MKELELTVRTMDSREIAELCGKRHSTVLFDIETQLSKIGGEQVFLSTYLDGSNRQSKCYKLPYRETMIIVSGYTVELRAKIIDRWMELELNEAKKLPTTFAEALRLAADQAEQIEIMQPKATYFDALVDRDALTNIRDTAKEIGIKEREFILMLECDNLIYHDAKKQIKPRAGSEQYFKLKDWIRGDKSGTQTLVTVEGKNYLLRRYGKKVAV